VARIKALAQRFKFDLIEGDSSLRDSSLRDFSPRYNLAPSQDALTVVHDKGRKLNTMRWGLVPSWSKNIATSYKMINARAETVDQKPTFKKLLVGKRCLVLADGYYEWQEVEGQKNKNPMRIVLKNREPFAFAGLYDTWVDPKGKSLDSFTIITTTASAAIQHVHDRMPVILREKDEEVWLDPGVKDISRLKLMLAPYHGDQLEAYPVSRLVNSPTNDVPACLERTP